MGLFGIGKKAYDQIGARELASQWPIQGAVMIDVRTKGEFASGHVQGAKHMDLMAGDFQNKLEALDKNATYYVMCRSGNRSGAAAGLMARMGFANVINVAGGIMSWPSKVV